METTITKRFAAIAVAVALCLGFVAPQAWALDTDTDAAGATATVELAPVNGQSSVDVAIKAGDEGTDLPPSLKNVSTFALAIDVEIMGDNPDKVSASFAFSDAVKALNPVITRPDTSQNGVAGSNTMRVNLYVSGVQDAFSAKSLDVGRLNLSVEDGSTAEVKVSVPDVANALSIVDSSYEQTDVPREDLFVPETPTMQLGDINKPPAVPSDGEDDGNTDIIGQTPDTNPNKNLPATGDAMLPIIIGLVCVAVAAVVVIVVMVVRRNRKNK